MNADGHRLSPEAKTASPAAAWRGWVGRRRFLNQRLTARQISADTGGVKETLDTLRPQMLEHYKAAVAGLCEMETKAR